MTETDNLLTQTIRMGGPGVSFDLVLPGDVTMKFQYAHMNMGQQGSVGDPGSITVRLQAGSTSTPRVAATASRRRREGSAMARRRGSSLSKDSGIDSKYKDVFIFRQRPQSRFL